MNIRSAGVQNDNAWFCANSGHMYSRYVRVSFAIQVVPLIGCDLLDVLIVN